jgi:hypothetical protein
MDCILEVIYAQSEVDRDLLRATFVGWGGSGKEEKGRLLE